MERHRLRNEFPDDDEVVQETWDDYVLEYSHRVKNFARFTRSIGDVQLKVSRIACLQLQRLPRAGQWYQPAQLD